MFAAPLWLLCLAISPVHGQTPSSVSTTTAVSASSLSSSSSPSSSSSSDQAVFSYTQNVSIITSNIPTSAFTGSQFTYQTNTGQRTVSARSSSRSNSTFSTSSARNSQVTRSYTSDSFTEIIGTASPTSANGTASSTSASPTAANTVPCNNYPEFCNRKYSNITEVCAHNAAFAVRNNAASNQVYDITTQLNDGIRMLQGETQFVNDTVYSCHTSCDLLNAGPFQSNLETLVTWLEAHPYDVVTWLIGNSDFVDVQNYVAPIENSGIRDYLYEPAYVPQRLDQWPTLGQMILSGKRVVLFMDYNANQNDVPYILDEFTHMWETPFSPTNRSFPCTQERPPNLNATIARDEYMYIANHNLNAAIDVSAILGQSGDTTVLIPNTAEIRNTNGQYNQFGQLGAMALNCTADWSRPPNFLLVDYYNYGDPGPGSVFEVAAQMNGVTYSRPCCGVASSPAPTVRASLQALAVAVGFAVLLAM